MTGECPPTELVVGSSTNGGATQLTVQEVLDTGGTGDATESTVTSALLEMPLEGVGDVWPVLRGVRSHISVGGRLTVRYAAPAGYRLETGDVENLLRLSGFEPVRRCRASNWLELEASARAPSVRPFSTTVVVPCRDEVDNVGPLVERVPELGTHTELIFVDGASTDGTPERIEQLIHAYPDRDIKLIRQRDTGGKAGAVYQGFDAAGGDILIILDADMAVAPEDLPRFFLALAEDVADFANGTRFVYPMEQAAMRPMNNLGNRVFSSFLSWLLGARVTDTLCGTKALFKRDWLKIAPALPLFGGHDPWGDFDLLLSARYEGLRLIDVPVCYRARLSGESKMQPLRHGVSLALTCLAGVRRLKAGPRNSTTASP